MFIVSFFSSGMLYAGWARKFSPTVTGFHSPVWLPWRSRWPSGKPHVSRKHVSAHMTPLIEMRSDPGRAYWRFAECLCTE